MQHTAPEGAGLDKKMHILLTAGELFLSQGYNETTVRQIAGALSTSPGLITYYYPSKRDMAVELLRRQHDAHVKIVHTYVDQKNEPLLWSAVFTKFQWAVMTSPKFYRFHIDTMQGDIFHDVAINSGISTYQCMREKYHLDVDDEMLNLYGNYVYAGIGRMLTLEADKGNFLVSNIPDMMIKSSVGHLWGTEEQLDAVCKQAELITANMILENTSLLQQWSFLVVE